MSEDLVLRGKDLSAGLAPGHTQARAGEIGRDDRGEAPGAGSRTVQNRTEEERADRGRVTAVTGSCEWPWAAREAGPHRGRQVASEREA